VTLYLRTTVIIPADSAVPRDAVQNTFAWRGESDPDPEDAADEINARLDAFYTGINNMISSAVDTNAIAVKHYNYADAVPRIPFREDIISAGASSTSGYDLPAEVAIVCTFEGAKASGYNMRRRRGRIYVGPLQIGAADSPLVPSSFVDTLADSAEANLLGSTGGPYDMTLAVYSRSTHYGKAIGDPVLPSDDEVPANLDNAFVPVVRLWVDDAWDTQRRRGVGDTVRDVRSV